MARQLANPPAAAGRNPRPPIRLLAAIAAAGLLLITLYGLHLVSTVSLVAVPTALFLSVYLASMAAAARVLRGPARAAALPAALAVVAMLAYCGWALAIPAIVALAVTWRSRSRRRGHLELTFPDTRPGQGATHRECRHAA
jgi:amino acid efflux transporter